MKFKKLNSNKEVNVNINQYKIDWSRKVSGPQKAVKDFLRHYWLTHCVLEEFRIPGSLLRCDLININLKIVLEVSPSQHTEYNPFFHGSRAGYLKSLKRDMDKQKWAEDNGFLFVEVFDEDLKEGLSKQWFLDKYQITL